MRLALHFFQQSTPLSNAIALRALQADVSGGCEQAVLQVLAKAVGDGEGDDTRRDSGGHSDDGDDGDHSNYGLTALGSQVPPRNEELKGHCKAEY